MSKEIADWRYYRSGCLLLQQTGRLATLALLPHFSANATSQETCNNYSKAIRMDPAASVVVEDRDYAAPQAHSN